MFDMFIQIPGPTFLGYFIYLSIACIIIGKLMISFDGSTRYAMPSPTQLSPIALAALRGGRNAVIQTALFRLWQRGLITIDGGSIKRVPISQHSPEGKIEEAIYQFAQTEQAPRDLITNSALLSQIDKYLEPIYHELERLHLKYDTVQLQRAGAIMTVMMSIIAIVGGSKLILGIVRDRPVSFLVVLLIIALIAAHVILKVKTPATYLGWRYLKETDKSFSWMKEMLKKQGDTRGIDPAYGIAIFGLSVIAGIAVFAAFSDAFATAFHNPSGGDGSSWGDSGSSGGCGGSDGGGGGCGGCGGGGD